MKRDTLLLVLTLTGSALCWWPAIIEPSLDFPRGFLLALLALMTALATSLSRGRWWLVPFVSVAGTLAGLYAGFALLLAPDAMANGHTQSAILMGTLVVVPVALVAGLLGRPLRLWNQEQRRVVWLALACCAAVGPVALALTPPLVARRAARNDRVAEARFDSLKHAVEKTAAEGGDFGSAAGGICDGQALKSHYSGPPFSDTNWQHITTNYVRQDGYLFVVFCRQEGGYTIGATPARGKADGTRQFCSDESRKVGCAVGRNPVRYACLPCPS